jgi:hypothetical protein
MTNKLSFEKTSSPAIKSLTDEDILLIADKWVKESGWMDFERNDFIRCVRECIEATGQKGAA